MLIASPWTGCNPNYARMAAVLEYTARKHNPGAEVRVWNVDPRATNRSDAFVVKAREWTRLINDSPDGTELVLLDTDTMVLGELASAFEYGQLIAVTTRGGQLSTLNSGALYVRVDRYVRIWFEDWERETWPWVARNEPHRIRFGDQDALKLLCVRATGTLRSPRPAQLPCAIWNAEQHCWPPDPDCRVVHVKSDARRILFGGRLHGNPGADVVAQMWLEAETELRLAGARTIEPSDLAPE